MSLIICSECSSKISSKAAACPHCGHPLASESWLSGLCGLPWRELYRDEVAGRALYIARDIIELKRFDEYGSDSGTWSRSLIRQYLNGKFFQLLPQTMKDRVLTVKNNNCDNPKYGTRGSLPTNDKVFLLSIDEASFFFQDNENREAIDRHGIGSWWWLRTPGGIDYAAAIVDASGSIREGGCNAEDDKGGVRPAMWISLFTEATRGMTFDEPSIPHVIVRDMEPHQDKAVNVYDQDMPF